MGMKKKVGKRCAETARVVHGVMKGLYPGMEWGRGGEDVGMKGGEGVVNEAGVDV